MQNILVGTTSSRADSQKMTQQLGHRFTCAIDYLESPSLNLAFSDNLHFHQDNDIIISISGYIKKMGATDLLKAMELYKLYLSEGLECLQNLDGAFIILIKDGEQIHLIRDAAGRRSVYYHYTAEGHFAFANEPKSIYRLPWFKKEINESSMFRYFTFSFIPGKETMLKNIYEVNPGEIISFSKTDGLRSSYHFSCLNVKKDNSKSTQDWISSLRTEIDTEIQTFIKYKGRVGSFLSGGLDSSIITVRAAKMTDAPLNTYSIHFGKKYQNELEYARLISNKYKTAHTEFEIKPKSFKSIFHEIINALDEPIGDPITVPNYLMAREASNNCDLILNGEGGDPCFGGPKNFEMLLHNWYLNTNAPLNQEKAYLASYRRGFDYLKHFLNKDFILQHQQKHTLEKVLSPYFSNMNLNYLDRLMSINILEKGGHLILPKVERMMALASVSSISPMFTKKIIELSMQMPSVLKLNQGIEKQLFKLAYSNEIPSEIIERPKSGMRVPVHFWFKGEMKRYAKKLLLSDSFLNTGYFNKEGIKLLLKYDNENGLRRHGLLIWMLLTFETWRRNVFDN